MKDSRKFVQVGTTVLTVLAWVSLALQVAVGLILLIGGGVSVPIGGVDVPARLVGLLNCLAGAIYFFMLSFFAHVVRLLLAIHAQVTKSA